MTRWGGASDGRALTTRMVPHQRGCSPTTRPSPPPSVPAPHHPPAVTTPCHPLAPDAPLTPSHPPPPPRPRLPSPPPPPPAACIRVVPAGCASERVVQARGARPEGQRARVVHHALRLAPCMPSPHTIPFTPRLSPPLPSASHVLSPPRLYTRRASPSSLAPLYSRPSAPAPPPTPHLPTPLMPML